LEGVRKALTQQRAWLGGGGGGGALRVSAARLYIEFLSGSLLWDSQNALLDDFARAVASRRSLLQQLMMGQGKTQVLTPLVCLMLGDGRALAAVCTPLQLLPQMVEHLSGALCNAVLDRPLCALRAARGLGRGAAGPAELAALARAVAAQPARGGVLLAPPDALKSLLLTAAELRAEGGGGAAAAAAADAADELLAALRARACAVVDECDMVLHPLRSELNYPLGVAESLRVGGDERLRTALPLFLVGAVVSVARLAAAAGAGGAREARARAECAEVDALGADARAERDALRRALRDAADARALRLDPLLVHDERDFAERVAPRVAPLLLRWLLLRLCAADAARLPEGSALRARAAAFLASPPSAGADAELRRAVDGTQTLAPALNFARALLTGALVQASARPGASGLDRGAGR
jgi:hypothetical protein